MTYDDYDADAAEQRFDADMEQIERIEQLESLVRDMWGYMSGGSAYCDKCNLSDQCDADPYGEDCMEEIVFRSRMGALGLLGGDA